MTTSSSRDFCSDGWLCAESLDKCPKEALLSPGSDDTSISVVVIDAKTSTPLEKAELTSYAELKSVLSASSGTNSTSIIISLSSYGSYDPLRIRKEDLQQLIIDENVGIGFAELIASFGELPRRSEQGFGCVSRSVSHDGSYSISYLLRFAERDNEGNWKIRQMGVYEKYSAVSDSHLWILLQTHPSSEDTLSKRMDFMFRQESFRDQFNAYPFGLHDLVLSTYLPEWRWYLQNLGRTYSTQSNTISTVRPGRDPNFGLTLRTLQDCKKLMEDIIPVPAIAEATLEIIDSLESIESHLRSTKNGPRVARYRSKLNDTKRSSTVLIKQTQGIVELLGNTLDLKNQQDAAKVSSHLYDLTLHTTKDSATIMVITVVAMFYLPATFIATLFGMNFFVFNATTRRIQLSQDVWIYVVIFVPLTGLTLLFGWQWRKVLMKSKDFGNSLEMKDVITSP